MSEYEARQALQQVFDHYEPLQEVRRGLLGDSGGTVDVPDRPGWAYIRYREDLSRLSHVRYLLQEQLPDETPVIVGRKHPADPFVQVLGVDWAMYAYSPASGTVQQWATQAITLNDLAPGKVVPTNPASLSVDVRAFLYVNGDTAVEYGGGQIDLTGSVPGVAGHRLTLVYIDLDTDALAAEDGAIVAVGTDAVAPTVPENSVPLAVVDLANGDADIPAGDIYQYKVIYDSVGGEIPLSMLADYARGHIIRGGAADWEAYDASTDGYALVGDGTDILSTATPNWKDGTHTFTPGDDQAAIFEMDAAQSVDIFQIKDSGGTVIAGHDERGIPFANGGTDNRNYFAGNDAGRTAASDYGIVVIGYQAGDALTSGGKTVLIGMGAGGGVQDADHIVAIGYDAVQFATSGGYNVGVGSYATRYNQTGEDNVGVGFQALQGNAGSPNIFYMTAVGSGALSNAQTGSEYDSAFGYSAGGSLTTGDRGIFLGAYAGYRQTTADDRLLVDNRQRADIATELTHSILYGTMGANPEDQQLTINVDALTVGTDADSDVVMTWQANSNDGIITWMEDEDAFVFSDIVQVGDGTNYTEIDATGDVSFTGTARIDWGKITADNVTLNNGTTVAGVVGDLQTLGDGNFYHVDEAAGAPGIDLEVEFVSVTAFNWVQIKAVYDGSTTHAVGIQLYNFNTTTWDTFNAAQTGQEDVSNAGEYILNSYDFFVPSDTNYIGTGGDAGDVRVRFHHTMAGNASHDLYIDVVALYQ